MAVYSDDYPSIQDAIDDAALQQTKLIISPGDHYVDPLLVKQGITAIDGEDQARLIANSATDKGVIQSGEGEVVTGGATSNFQILNLEIDGNGLAKRSIMLNEVQDVTLYNLTLYGNDISGGAKPAVNVYHNSARVIVEFCTITNDASQPPEHHGIFMIGRTDGDWWSTPSREDTTDGYFFPITTASDNARMSGDALLIDTDKFRSSDLGAKVYLADGSQEWFARVDTVVSSNEVLLVGDIPPGTASFDGESRAQPGAPQYTTAESSTIARSGRTR